MGNRYSHLLVWPDLNFGNFHCIKRRIEDGTFKAYLKIFYSEY
ncbi:hypothetical protein LEP1GSC052_0600 [Leptospira kmetyi serovar Malaysia str. Bejo-Iso9]|nr:hypothetical protein LEP1GSC052_0600 [Leptospira kmetyi serovar Malaysia str. Bejo-Iso9]